MEELKMILEVVKTAGEGAYTLTIVYFARDFFESLLILVGVLTPFALAYKFGKMAHKAYTVSGRICNALGQSFPEYQREIDDLEKNLKAFTEWRKNQ